MHPVSALLLDLDGTLVDSEHLHYESTAAVLFRRGFNLSSQQYEMYEGWAECDCWISINQRFGFDFDPYQAVSERSEILVDLLRDRQVVALPGARELLAWARQEHIPMALATSLPHRQIDALLDAAGLNHFLPVRISAHDDLPQGRGKPAPDVYLKAASAVHCEPGTSIAFEDSAVGMASARAAGCKLIAVGAKATANRGIADFACLSLHEALVFLKGLP